MWVNEPKIAKKWAKKYKEGGKVDSTKFDPEGEGYDYPTAKASGGKPDSIGHWGSLDPRTGMVLKGRGHSTWDLTVKKETELGNKIIKKADGRYYSIPDTTVKKYKEGGRVKPERSTIFHGSPDIDLIGSLKRMTSQDPPKKAGLDVYRKVYNAKLKLRKGLIK